MTERAGRMQRLRASLAVAVLLATAVTEARAACGPTLASVTQAGQLMGNASEPSLSADGRYVAFVFEPADRKFPEGVIPAGVRPVPSSVGIIDMILIRDSVTGQVFEVHTDWVDGTGHSWSMWIDLSADGETIAFTSTASDLVPGDSSFTPDVFAFDWRRGMLDAISADASGSPGSGWSNGSSVSADGRFVAFSSDSVRLVPGVSKRMEHVYVRDRLTATTALVSVTSDGRPGDAPSGAPELTADGSVVAFSSLATDLVEADTNGKTDVFFRRLADSTTQRISVSSSGMQSDGWSFGATVSSGGRYVAFRSDASNLTALSPLASQPHPDGRRYSIYRRDTVTDATELVSYGVGGAPTLLANSYFPSMSRDGNTVVFASTSLTLDPPDTNDEEDVFVNVMDSGSGSRMLSRKTRIGWSTARSYDPDVSADGARVAFVTEATDIAPDDTNDGFDIVITCIP